MEATVKDSLSDYVKNFMSRVKTDRKPRLTGPQVGDWCVVVKDDAHGRVKTGDHVVIVDDSRLSGGEGAATYGIYVHGRNRGLQWWFNKDLFKVEHKYSEYSDHKGHLK